MESKPNHLHTGYSLPLANQYIKPFVPEWIKRPIVFVIPWAVRSEWVAQTEATKLCPNRLNISTNEKETSHCTFQ